MDTKFVATSAVIDASADRIWAVMTDPLATKEFMFGTELTADWRVGGDLRWRGTWNGKEYEDKGVVLEFEPSRKLVTTHFSPLGGTEEARENYHTLTWTLEKEGDATRLTLCQDNNDTAAAAAHAQGMWDSLVASVKAIAERQ